MSKNYKYISIDLETTGLNPTTCQILSFGAVIEQEGVPLENLPKFHKIIRRKLITGEPFALDMNQELIKTIKEGIDDDIIRLDELVPSFIDFLKYNKIQTDPNFVNFWGDSKYKIKVAGKNFATFDKLFLDELSDWKENIKTHQRILDPSPLYFEKGDEWLPNLQTCLDRANIKSDVTHNACDDALDVIKVLRHKGI